MKLGQRGETCFLQRCSDTSKKAPMTMSINSSLPKTSVPNLCDNAAADGT